MKVHTFVVSLIVLFGLKKNMAFEFFEIVALIGLLNCVLVELVGTGRPLSMGSAGELPAHRSLQC